MNRIVARAFSAILSTLHLVFFGSVAVIAVEYFNGSPNGVKDTIYWMGITQDGLIALLVVACIVYVLIMGVISTFVAINENLEAIRDQRP